MLLRTTLLTTVLGSLAILPGAVKAEEGPGRHRVTPLEIRRKREAAEEKAERAGGDFSPLPRVPRIIGGNQAMSGEYPWMAALVSADEPSNYDAFFCGGSLIHPYWVLTASHCVVGSKAEDLEVVLGATNLNSSAGVQRIPVAEIVMSPKFNDFTLDQDFALLRLAQPANASLTPIPMLDAAELAVPGTFATVTGWGDTTDGNRQYPAQLQEVQVPIVDLAVANATAAYEGTLTENMLPAGYQAGGKDSCSGDSGGPLLVPSAASPTGFMQAGIVSFGSDQGCAVPDAYGIYSRVEKFRRFILGHTLPNYAAWELANGRSGELRDPDGNGFTNFEDFALPGHVLEKTVSGGFAKFTWVRPALSGEVDYILENAPSTAGPWTAKAATFVGVEQIASDRLRWTVQLPQAQDTGVFRVRAAVAQRVERGPRLITFGSGVNGSFDNTGLFPAPVPPTDYQGYRLTGMTPGQTATVTLRSNDFDAGLILQDAANRSVDLQTSYGNNAGGGTGKDESLSFVVQPGIDYLVQVVGVGGAGGDYELSLWNSAAQAALPALTIPATGKPKSVKGRITVDDAYDPFFLPGGEYLKDDYRLELTLEAWGKMLELRMNSKGRGAAGIDDFIGLVDAESGRLVTGNDNLNLKSNNAVLRFLPIPGKAYTVRASSAEENDTGTYGLSGGVPKLSPKTPLATIALGATAAGKLGKSSEVDEHYFTPKRDYLLDAVNSPTSVFVTLASGSFDAYLFVLDASTLQIVKEADSGGPAGGLDNARVEFTAEPGKRYLLRAATYKETESGSYVIATGVNP
ncbi:serine protease [Haloferula sp. BvORR071]|uniref:S1 family serine peptidase n=1 Tax=Haloferula sp. BvORR071 TaxID=1396141 RepID=UPI000697AFC7|nr:serine protease [Haloferula sp. BvORR071]